MINYLIKERLLSMKSEEFVGFSFRDVNNSGENALFYDCRLF